MFFQTYKRSEFTIAQKLYFELSPKFSDSAVILAIALSKRCTEETCKLWKRKARVLDFCFPTMRPFQKIFFRDYFFTARVDFKAVCSINFLFSSAFRKALEQGVTSSSVSRELKQRRRHRYDGSQHVAKKVNLRPLKLYRVYWDSLNLSNVGVFFFLNWIPKDFIQVQGKLVVVCLRPR